MASDPPQDTAKIGRNAGSTLDARESGVTRPSGRAQTSGLLVVFEGTTSRLVSLPESGEIVIGRADACHVVLRQAGVSRQHARIWIDHGHTLIADLDSQNGTRLNGKVLSGTAVLHSGDEISLSEASIIFYTSPAHARQDGLLDAAAFRARVEAELTRALKYVRSVTVAALPLGARTDRASVRLSVDPVLGSIESVSLLGDDTLLWLLPEHSAEEAEERARVLSNALAASFSAVRVGLATFPDDGIDADTLLSAAREAGREAGEGEVQRASRTFKELLFGEHRVWIADVVMLRLYALIERLAKADLPVLVMGETGAGKELAATALHHLSPRAAKRLVTVNCAAMQESLIESELFGHERGAFTGAVATRIGALEAAEGGTVFLDELGELSLASQAKLLRALETRRITRVGSTREREVDFRVIAATNRNLEAEVKAGRFRQDLFFRLSAATVWLPPLRDRKRELLILARAFLDRACARAGRAPLELSAAAVQLLAQHAWPGNVRELRNLMDFIAATAVDETVEPWHIAHRVRPTDDKKGSGTEPESEPAPPVESLTHFRPIAEEIAELERKRMLQALHLASWNQTRAALALGMPLRTFVTKMRQYDLRKERGR
ncbi:Sigma-54 dependent transcriptional regulator [Sorangium cellulosum So ce56]|uniref:Sigma-54 dependent transcriptional regulator n=1 Tax=Sorangium cellulosum (strain So ce56) TaxID=448385 RepID=A9GDL4_SORC5|nr:sigma-54-dependent Fis family transcriptional regulator [Sorangium cellulosum]CAN99371.1 Sigma-54 dependent transcriptional regulator [Sorangium cellulosum So ce56]